MRTTGLIFPRSWSLLEGKYNRRSPVITWLSPQENDTFGPWDILTAKWNSQQVWDSPAFRLCSPPDDSSHLSFLPGQNETEESYFDDNCGSKISPIVEENHGSSLISFTVPNVTEDAFFLLQMNDASGVVLSSPIFKLTSHSIHAGVRTHLPDFTLDTEPQKSPSTSASHQPSPAPAADFTILLVFLCMLLMTPPILWLWHRHRENLKMYFRRLSVSRTSTPALLQKIDPGDGTSVPIPLFMPTYTSRAPSQSMRPLFLPTSLGRASGVHQPLHAGSSRSFRLPNRYFGGPMYPSLPPIPTSSNTFINEGSSALANIHMSRRAPLPPGLVSTPPRVHLHSSD